jgi:hypothetical protein
MYPNVTHTTYLLFGCRIAISFGEGKCSGFWVVPPQERWRWECGTSHGRFR